MKERFTSGEWRIAMMDNRTRIVIESENTGFCVADIMDISDTDKANAMLIAAAPEMYAMLESIKRTAEWGYSHAETGEEIIGMMSEVSELLAKARGEKL